MCVGRCVCVCESTGTWSVGAMQTGDVCVNVREGRVGAIYIPGHMPLGVYV